MIIGYDFNKTDSPDAKQIIIFLYEMHFNIHAKSKSSRDKNIIKNYYNRRTLVATGLQEVILLSEKLND